MARLVLLQGGNEISHAITGSNTVIGRDAKSGIQLLAEGISRTHAQITKDGEHYFLEDLDSANGTFVNGKRIDDVQQLQQGDRIKLCGLLLVFHAESQEFPGEVSAPVEEAAPADASVDEDRFSATQQGLAGPAAQLRAQLRLEAARKASRAVQAEDEPDSLESEGNRPIEEK